MSSKSKKRFSISQKDAVRVGRLRELKEIKISTDGLNLMTLIVSLNFEIPLNSASFREMQKQKKNPLSCFSSFFLILNWNIDKIQIWG